MRRRKTNPGDDAPRYVPRPGSNVTHRQAAAVGADLEAMKRERIRRSPRNLWKRARQSIHPLHSAFTWDNDMAGDRWREHEARELMASVCVAFIRPGQPDGWRRGFLSVNIPARDAGKGREYTEIETIVRNPSARDQVSRETYGQLQACARLAEEAELPQHDRAWKHIVGAIRTYIPRAVGDGGT